MDRYADYFEWWDDSKIGLGEDWQRQIDIVFNTSVAVVFLSRAYLLISWLALYGTANTVAD